MMSTLYSVGQMNQVGDALENAGFTPAEVEKFRQFNNLAGIRAIINGLAEINQRMHVIDCDANPLIPYDGWKIGEHKKSGQFVWDPTKVNLFLSSNQQNGKTIRGDKLRNELINQPVLNANVLDYLLNNPHLIPEEWKVDEQGRTRYIFFWGTIYRDSDDNLYVRCLYWNDGLWQADNYWLGHVWDVNCPSAVSAS